MAEVLVTGITVMQNSPFLP